MTVGVDDDGSARTVLRDKDIRLALAAAIGRQYRDSDYLLVPEVDIICGIPGRIDALLVADRIWGFEIKSDLDTLRRLPRQLEAYGPVLERGTLVAAARHIEGVEKLLPPWWGIWVVIDRAGTAALTVHRSGKTNPGLSLHAVAEFIPREGLVRHLRTQGVRGYSKYSVYELRDQVVRLHSRREFLSLARWVMSSRGDWRYRALWPGDTVGRSLAQSGAMASNASCACPVCQL
ncbi:sce7726 family protein [Mycolicibacterium fortuitum]|uniref:sce7726 family protein n=1 Tax=Mycolicibacterium fortuitum TaxID=1766 RepID=UPI001CE067F8|nr:sce7726 family protein [Mycolicibacterium fortuitum]MCA4727204.1 sce7726 family protein [Mycolicibacterium fortuitum]